ncbi:hypothetical protein FA95DRAFT_1606351 [Auriscalpium vulgare]|uniref:Uncharacterized protein n=1 Tax=Auriscalpium vulgare TaxID=40419 RepID=A0ACB8RS21_9AGAM|nr:hypothetical protein FA95DRAFT_1606351 [Auriscalpium vulgare]
MSTQKARNEHAEANKRIDEVPGRTEPDSERGNDERSLPEQSGEKDAGTSGGEVGETSASKDKGKQKAIRPESPRNSGEDAREELMKVMEEFAQTIDENISVTNGAIDMATEAMKRANAARDSTQQLRERWTRIRDKLRTYNGLEIRDEGQPKFKYLGITHTLAELLAPRGEGESAKSHAYREEVAKGYFEWKKMARDKLISMYENLRTEKEMEEENLTRDLERGAAVYGSIEAATRVWDESLKRGEREAFKNRPREGMSRRNEAAGEDRHTDRRTASEPVGNRDQERGQHRRDERDDRYDERRNGGDWDDQADSRRNEDDGRDDRADDRRRGGERTWNAGGAPGGGDHDDSSDDDNGSFHGRRNALPRSDANNGRGRANDANRREITPDYQAGGRDSAAVTKIRQTVREGLTEELPELPKGFKVPVLPKYDGSDKPERFGTFTSDFMTWIQLSRLVDPKYRAAQIMSLGTALEGEASEWYMQEIKDPERQKRIWTLEEAIVAPYGRFIHKASIQEAFVNFRRTRYDPNRGLVAYYKDLRKWAQRMAEHPDSYTFNRKLMQGMPQHLLGPAMLSRNLSAEYSTAEEIMDAVIAVQDRDEFLSTLTRGKRVITDETQPAIRKVPAFRNRQTGARARLRNSDASPNKLAADQPASGSGAMRTGIASRGHDGRNAPVSHNKPSNPGRFDTRNRASGSNRPKPNGGAGVTCCACGQVGHYSSDPKCPQYGKAPQVPRLHAVDVTAGDAGGDEGEAPSLHAVVEVEDDDESIGQRAHDDDVIEVYSEYESEYDGSQYDTDEELAVNTEYETDDKFDDVQYFGGMTLGADRRQAEQDMLEEEQLRIQHPEGIGDLPSTA